MKQIIIVLSLLSCNDILIAQKIERIVIDRQNQFHLYASPHADSASLFYLKIVPKTKPIGVLVILPAGGDLVEEVTEQVPLYKLAVEKSFLVIIPSINDGPYKFDVQQKFLDIIFRQLLDQYKIPEDKFVLGGLSGGGMLALSYTEKAIREKGSTVVVPKAIFSLDAAVDYVNLYHAEERDAERNFSQAATREARGFVASCKTEFGGTPEKSPAEYIRYSIYSHSEKDGGNAKYLIHEPILIYTEPGIEWQLKNRHRDLYDLNCLDISAMINFLHASGNKQAELKVTHDKGVRLDGTKHPHSWSIMDNQECLNWILKQLG